MFNSEHWHYPEVSGCMTDDGYEVNVDFPVVRTRQEAVTEYGKEDDYYIWQCYDEECIVDCDWFNTPDPVWRRND
jgi:hypothetical protein